MSNDIDLWNDIKIMEIRKAKAKTKKDKAFWHKNILTTVKELRENYIEVKN